MDEERVYILNPEKSLTDIGFCRAVTAILVHRLGGRVELSNDEIRAVAGKRLLGVSSRDMLSMTVDTGTVPQVH